MNAEGWPVKTPQRALFQDFSGNLVQRFRHITCGEQEPQFFMSRDVFFSQQILGPNFLACRLSLQWPLLRSQSTRWALSPAVVHVDLARPCAHTSMVHQQLLNCRHGAGHPFRGDGVHLNPIALETVFLPLALQLAKERRATRVVSDSFLCSATEEGERGDKGGEGEHLRPCWGCSFPSGNSFHERLCSLAALDFLCGMPGRLWKNWELQARDKVLLLCAGIGVVLTKNRRRQRLLRSPAARGGGPSGNGPAEGGQLRLASDFQA